MEAASADAARKGMPACLLMLFIMLCVFLLSAFPPTGIFLMLFGGPLWSILLVNLAFCLALYDVLCRGRSKFLLLLPALYFGGYGALTLFSHLGGQRYVIDTEAGPNIIPLGPDQVLAIEGHFGIEMEDFLSIYNLKGIDYKGQNSEIVVDGECNTYNFRHRLLPGPKCIIDGSGPAPAMLVRTTWNNPRDDGPLYYKSHHFDWRVTQGDKSRHVTGRVRTPLTWLPLPIVGCALSDQPSGWVCMFQFTFEDDISFLDPFASNGWDMALAHVTGVTPRP